MNPTTPHVSGRLAVIGASLGSALAVVARTPERLVLSDHLADVTRELARAAR